MIATASLVLAETTDPDLQRSLIDDAGPLAIQAPLPTIELIAHLCNGIDEHHLGWISQSNLLGRNSIFLSVKTVVVNVPAHVRRRAKHCRLREGLDTYVRPPATLRRCSDR